MRHKKWVICSVCNRKYKADGDTDYPVKHYVAPKWEVISGVKYLVDAPWVGNKEICQGTYKEGRVYEK